MKEEHKKLFEEAKSGDYLAQFQLFAAYASGEITGKPDFIEAFKWGDKAAYSGNAEIQFYYYLTLFQIGFEDKAFPWLLESAKNGYAKGQDLLSFWYYNNKDKKNARYWANEAYNNGAKYYSPFIFAMLFAEDKSSDKNGLSTSDKLKLVEYLKEAAANGNETAKELLNG